MARFRERFEVKKEINSDGDLYSTEDYKQSGGKASKQTIDDIEDARGQCGFDDWENFEDVDEEFEVEQKDVEEIKYKVRNYESCSIEEINEILTFIANKKREELGIDFEFETSYEDGSVVKAERTTDGKQQVEIGEGSLFLIKGDKELGIEVDSTEERKEFIELILAVFHELRHVKQNDNIRDNPISNEDTIRMTREEVINRSFVGFRNANYEQSPMEIDAMRASLEETARFFEEMGTNIPPDEVFEVMKEKELSYLDYDLTEFGDSYETAMVHFNYIYGRTTDIKGLQQSIGLLSDDKKAILDEQCQDLMDSYNAEPDMEKKMELLKQMSLRMSPELREKYPLAEMQIEIGDGTGFNLKSVNGKSITELEDKQEPIITNEDVLKELEEYYTTDIPIATTEAYICEKIEKIYGERLKKVGLTDIAKVFEKEIKYFEGPESYMSIVKDIENFLVEYERNDEAKSIDNATQENQISDLEDYDELGTEEIDLGVPEIYEPTDDILKSAISATKERTISDEVATARKDTIRAINEIEQNIVIE